MHDWPERVEQVAAYLRAGGAEARLEQFTEPVGTSRQVADLLGCSLAQIVVAEPVDCDGTGYLTLRSSDRALDTGKVARVTGARRVATAPADVHHATPFPPERSDSVLVDRGLLRRSPVWVGAGSPQYLVVLTPIELVRLTSARIETLTLESA